MSISFVSAYRLLLSIVLPSGTYGNSVFELSSDQETEHNMSIFGMFRKKWCNISHRWPSTTPIYHIFIDDALGIKFCNPA